MEKVSDLKRGTQNTCQQQQHHQEDNDEEDDGDRVVKMLKEAIYE